MFFIYFCVWGAVVGSFLNVVIYRLPRGFLLSSPRRSVCLSCYRRVPALENIPILSYLLLRGRCGGCRATIGARYLLVETMSGLLFGAVFLHFGLSWVSVYYCFLAAALLAITFIDLDHRIIPDLISLPSMVIGVLAAPWIPLHGGYSAVAGMVAGGGSFWLLSFLYFKATGREGLGFGDVKMLGMIGAFLGIKGVMGTIFISSLVGAVIGLVIMVAQKKNTKMSMPYGPFLAIGALTMLFWGDMLTALLFPAVFYG